MFVLASKRLWFLLGAFGAVTLLFALAKTLPQQNSELASYAAHAAGKETLAAMASRERSVRLVEGSKAQANAGSEPWTDSQVQQPADLAKELSDPKSKKPLVVCVGFDFLCHSTHIPGAVFHGSAGKPGGLAELKKWAQNVPRSQSILLYCGCCPWKQCPNIRPAFKAFDEMGFTRLKVLSLPTDLATDWVQKGFPIQKAK